MGGAQMTVDIAKGAEEMATALRGAGPTTNANAPDAARIAATVQALRAARCASRGPPVTWPRWRMRARRG